MATALDLRKRVDQKEAVQVKDALHLLSQSILVAQLLTPPNGRPETFAGLRAYEWRLLELCEIPFAAELPTVQNWLDMLIEKTSIAEGFSLTNTRDGVLGCHTSLLTRIMICHRADQQLVDKGIQWILDYQMLQKGEKCSWTGSDLYTRWGGCMKTTPCYYGVVKAMVTLQTYQETFGKDAAVQEKLNRGIEVMLDRELYKRKSTGAPIEPSIVENFFPYPYKTNLIELLTVIKKAGKLADERCKPALEFLAASRRKDGAFQADKVFMKSAWVVFDPLKKPGKWITYMIENILTDSSTGR
jgi:hypothetical protein